MVRQRKLNGVAVQIEWFGNADRIIWKHALKDLQSGSIEHLGIHRDSNVFSLATHQCD